MEVSVVIPSYNRADLLPFTLEAVLGQTAPAREVIVVDDGSSDCTQAVVGQYGSRVKVIRIENSGSIVARNVGLRAATAPWVAFCDSDDLWMPDFLEGMAALWRAEPQTKVAYPNFQFVRNDAWSSDTKFDEAPPGYWRGLRPLGDGMGAFDHPIVDRVVPWQPFFPSALAVDRKAMLDAGGWDEGVGRTVGDDFGTVLRLAELYPFGIIFTPLAGIRKHGGNFSGNVRAMNLGDADILEDALASRPSLAPYATLIRASAARRRRDALETAFVDGDFAAVNAIYQRLPPGARTPRARVKRLISGLPWALPSGIQKLLARGRTGP